MIHYDRIKGTLIGDVFIAATKKGLCAVSVGNKTEDRFREELARSFPGERIEKNPARLRDYRSELAEYFRGERKRFTVPVDLSSVRGPFHRKVLGALRGLPFGKLVTYGELAARCGSPRAARAVGAAMAANPLAIVVPCHRVIAASGGLGGYSAGLSRKRRLLSLEGVA